MEKQLTALQELNQIKEGLHALVRKYPDVHTFAKAWEALSMLGNTSYKLKELEETGLVLGSQVALSKELIKKIKGNENLISNEFTIIDINSEKEEGELEVTFTQLVDGKTYGFTILNTLENIKDCIQ